MTKAREIAELGQKLTVDASGNLEFAGDLELGDNNKALFGASSDLQIYHDGLHSRIYDTGTGNLILQGSSAIVFNAVTNGEHGRVTDGGGWALGYSGTTKLATTSTGIDVTGNALASDTFEIDSGGTGFLVGGGQTGTTAIGKLHNSAGVLTLDTDSTRSIKLATGTTQRLRVDGSTGDISFYEDTGTNVRMKWFAAEESLEIGAIQTGTNAPLSVKTNGSNHAISIEENNGAETWQIGVNVDGNLGFYNSGAAITPTVAFVDNGSAVFNDGSLDADFRVESDDNSHMLFVDGGADRVRIGSSNLACGALGVVGNIDNSADYWTDSNSILHIQNAHASGHTTLKINNSAGTNSYILFNATSTTGLDLYNRSTNRSMLFAKTGEVVVNEDSGDQDFRVESDSIANMFYLDASESEIGINTSDPNAMLGVFQSVGKTAMRLGSQTNEEAVILRYQGRDGNDITRYADIKFDALGGNERLRFQAPYNTGSPQLELSSTYGAVFNEGSADRDFRVESNNNANMLYVDASQDEVGIGTSSPDNKLEIEFSETTTDGSVSEGLLITNTSGTTGTRANVLFRAYDNYNARVSSRRTGSTVGDLRFGVNDGGATAESNISDYFMLYGNAGVIVNEDSIDDVDFRVESDTKSHMLFVDAASEFVAVGTNGIGSAKNFIVNHNSTMNGDNKFLAQFNDGSNSGIDGGVLISSYQPRLCISDNSSGAKWWDFKVDGPNLLLGYGDPSDYFTREIGGVQSWKPGSVVINDGGQDRDFRVESDGSNYMIFVDAGNNRLAFGYDSSPDKSFCFKASASSASWRLYDDSTNWVAFDPVSSLNRTVKFLNSGSGSLNVSVQGSLSKGSGSFKIDHPVASKADTHDLVHSFVEAPQADNIYRGKVDLVAGQATVNIDTVAGMTDGTFALLNREIQCFTSNETGWTAVRGSVSGNILTIEAQDSSCTDTISWLVIGERQDQHMYDTDWTDENGKVIVEPLKS